MSHDLISVVIPAYNEENYIENTLKSVRNQTYKNIELIVVDNASEDKTAEIAKKYCDNLLYLKEKGASKSRNYGAKNCKGDFLAFLDADTLMSENLTEQFRLDTKEGYRVIVPKIIPDKHNLKSKIPYFIINFTVKHIFPSYTPLIFIQRNLFEKLNGFSERIEMREELDLLFRARKETEIKYEDKASVVTSMRRFENKGYLNIVSKGVVGYFYKSQKWPVVR